MRENGKGRALALVWLIATAACGGDTGAKSGATPSVPMESTTVATTPATAGVRILFLGTSLTAGLGLDPDSAYPAVIQRLADSAGFRTTVVAAGLSGETSAGALRRVDWLLRDRADVVVLETGANDGLRGLDPDSTRANITGIIRKIRAANPGTRILLAQMEAPPNLGAKYTREFRDGFLIVARDQEVTLIPFFLEGVAGVPELNQEDGIHPTAEGARRAARNMWKALAPLLRDTPAASGR
jgi:acyl-CoA thioesterase-1